MSRERNHRGIAAMVAATAVFSLMDTGLKLLAPHYPALQVATLRGLASFPLVLVWVGSRGFRRVFEVRWGLHALRAGVSIAMLALFTVGVRRLPLAEAYSIFFVAPMLITALSALILKERVDAGRWLAIVVGLAGVFVVLRPTGAGMMTLSGVAVLGCAGLYAVSTITVRVQGRTDSMDSMVLWTSVLTSAAGVVLSASHWTPVRAEHAGILVMVGVSGFLGQVTLMEAFRSSEASAVAPFEYTALAWGVIIDRLLWHVLPDRYTLLGAAIIVASGVYLVRREQVHAEAEHP